MKKNYLKLVFMLLVLSMTNMVKAWDGMPMPRLHVDGRYLKDSHDNIVNLHGFAQTYSPWFNEQNSQWTNYDVEGCLDYNQGIIDGILDAGWKMNFVRMHMDPYWSNTPGCSGRYEGEECFNETRFKRYLDEVFVPMAQYAVSKGLYVVFRPPGVSPDHIEVGGVYHEYLIKVWGIVSQHPILKNHPNIMFELANEPIDILGPDGTYGAGTQGHFDNLKTYFQAIVDTIRASADNILWVPGLGYQSLYAGYAVNPIEGENIGYAVHVYPGWFNSGSGYEAFQNGWNNQVQPVADFAPIIVTEMDWAPEKYNASWGKDITGTAGGDGFGANFKKITDDCGNVSWLLFTSPDFLDDFDGIPPAEGEEYTFLNDPEACPWPVYHWYQDYATEFEPKPEFEYHSTSDHGNGTFSNPVIHADFPAPAVIREEDIYYMVSTNKYISPVSTILQSEDLVNWEYSNKEIDKNLLNNLIVIDTTDINSGTVIQTQSGEWWAMIGYNKGSYGTFPHLLPVSWEGGNPVIDETYLDSVIIVKPDVGKSYPTKTLVTNDVFRHYKMGAQWSWNGNPDDEKYSLLERAGYIRLRTVSVVDSVHKAENTLTQRIMAYPNDFNHSYGTIRMEIDSMKEGDIAGLTIFRDTFSFIGVKIISGEKKLVTFIDNDFQTGPTIVDTAIYLRAIANYNKDSAVFYYSMDNVSYTKLGSEVALEKEGLHSGNRFGIFNYATIETGGYIDIDWFSTESEFNEVMYYPDTFEYYTKESLTLTGINVEEGENVTVLSGSTTKLNINAIFEDGHIENITDEVQYSNYDSDLIKLSRGGITSFMDGNTNLDIDYTGPLDEHQHLSLNITSSTFPLTNKLFNPDIWDDGTFDETTKTLQTGQYGFGGWQYGGIDLSKYKYIVVKLGSDNNASVDFRIFDGSSYWGSLATFQFGSGREILVDLAHSFKDDGSLLNPQHIFIAGFWSNGSSAFIIDTIHLTNSGEYDYPVMLVKDENDSKITSLSGLNYTEGSGPSNSKSFIVLGDMLTENILVEAPENFEVSLNATEGYASELTLNQSDGVVDETTIFVRMKPELIPKTYKGSISISSAGAFGHSVSVSGKVEAGVWVNSPVQPGAIVISTSYYTLTGQKINNVDNIKGIYIVKKIYSDGTISTTKNLKSK